MNHATSILLALFGLAAAAPAQVRLEGILGRHIQVGVQVGGRDDHGARQHGGDRDRGRDQRGRDSRRGGDHREHGRWETVHEQVHIPGYWREEFHPARYGWLRDACGRRVWGIVEPAHTCREWVPPRCETRSRRVWVRC